MAKPSRRDQSPSPQLDRFTDREDHLAVFRRSLNAPTEQPVLMFYGVGGAGKTWLLGKLRKDVSPGLPTALIDFDIRLGGQRFSSDSTQALHEIRQQLGKPAPRFDLAYAMRLFKQGMSSEPGFKGQGVAGATTEVCAELVGAAHPGIGAILNRLSKQVRKLIRGTAVEQFLATHSANELLLSLRPLTAQEIDQNLSDYLAADLRESLKPSFSTAVRVVLFFDTFEALGAGLLNTEHQRAREQWIQDLAGNLDFALIVIAGQNRLTWNDADPRWNDTQHLEHHLVGGLSEYDARLFLSKCDITDPALQDAILFSAHDVDDNGKHCFSLALCGDIVLTERRVTGHDPAPESIRFRPQDWEALARRFLKSLDSDAERRWIARLAVTPRFDEAAAQAAFSKEHSAAQDAAWHALLDYSFLQRTPGTSDWYNIRSQMSWALENQPSEQDAVSADHAWWRSYWEARSKAPIDECASLAWYHRHTLEPEAALAHWNELAKSARSSVPLRMLEHFSLLKWWDPVGLLDGAASTGMARAADSFGFELRRSSLGNRAANLAKAISCHEAALRVRTEADFPQDWAVTQNNLGNAWTDLPTGDRAANLAKAISYYEAALRVRIEADFPQDWAVTQNNLGNTWGVLPTGNRAANLAKAISCHEAALRVRTETDLPRDWALTQNSLGNAWWNLPTGDRAANLAKAIGYYEAALRVHTEVDFPREWALTQNNLGNAWGVLPTGNRAANLAKAISCYEAALRVFTEVDFPQDWALTQNNLGSAWGDLPTGDRAANLAKAISCYEAALRVRTEADFPQDWAVTQHNLGTALLYLPTGDRAANLAKAIGYYEAALRVHTEVDFPREWALTQNNLGNAWGVLPTGDRAANLAKAISCYEAALRVFTEADFPQQWATTLNNLGTTSGTLRLIDPFHR